MGRAQEPQDSDPNVLRLNDGCYRLLHRHGRRCRPPRRARLHPLGGVRRRTALAGAGSAGRRRHPRTWLAPWSAPTSSSLLTAATACTSRPVRRPTERHTLRHLDSAGLDYFEPYLRVSSVETSFGASRGLRACCKSGACTSASRLSRTRACGSQASPWPSSLSALSEDGLRQRRRGSRATGAPNSRPTRST